MTQASGSASQLLLIPEKVWGETPLPADVKSFLLGFSKFGESLSSESSELVSDVITSQRGTADVRNGLVTTSGSIPFELSLLSSELLFYFVLGSFTQVKEGAKFVKTFKRAKNLPSFSIEKGFTDINQYFMLKGCKVNSLQMTVEPDGLVTGSIDVIGKSIDNSQTSFSTEFEEVVHSAYAGLDAVILEGGQAAQYTSFNFTLANNANSNNVIGSKYIASLNAGKAEATGELSVMFEDVVMYTKWASETQTDIKLKFTKGEDYVEIVFPKVKFNGNALPPIDSAEGILQTLNFRGLLDLATSTDVTVKISNDFDFDAFINYTPPVSP